MNKSGEGIEKIHKFSYFLKFCIFYLRTFFLSYTLWVFLGSQMGWGRVQKVERGEATYHPRHVLETAVGRSVIGYRSNKVRIYP